MKKFFLFISISLGIFAKDLSIKMGEDGINKFLSSVGSFKSEKIVDLKLTTLDIIWKISEAKINLSSNGSKFTAKIEIDTGDKVRKGTIEGDSVFSFDTEKQILTIDITNMKVRGLDIYDTIGFYKPKYEFPVKIMQKDKIAIKENKIITGYVIPTLYDDTVTVVDNAILIESDLKFVEVKN